MLKNDGLENIHYFTLKNVHLDIAMRTFIIIALCDNCLVTVTDAYSGIDFLLALVIGNGGQ